MWNDVSKAHAMGLKGLLVC